MFFYFDSGFNGLIFIDDGDGLLIRVCFGSLQKFVTKLLNPRLSQIRKSCLLACLNVPIVVENRELNGGRFPFIFQDVVQKVFAA